ncbi:MAG: hypothetical protein ABS78_11425 [Phenylobacterium sp. SCN 70-31]|nr:MAG: hypothetical protein ABS78_11425 [Phenylobacterium sp. SCN 70-31]
MWSLLMAGTTASAALLSVGGAQAEATAQPEASAVAELVVTARRRAEALERVPVATTVFGEGDIAARQLGTQSDLQRATPGLIVRQTQNRNQQNFAIRGQSIDAYSQSQPGVLTYVDDFHNPVVSASAFFDLASIQVLKGPQGTLFGRNTTGGAVLLTTNRPRFDGFGGDLTATVGNYGARKLTGALNVPISDTFAVRLAGSTDRRDGYVYNAVDGSRLSETDADSIRLSVLWEPGTSFSNSLVYQYNRSGGLGDPNQVFSANAPGDTEPNGTPLNATSATFFGPALDSLAGPGAYAALRAVTPGAPAGGFLEAVQRQRAAGPWVAWLNFPLDHSGRSYSIVNATTYRASEAMTIKTVVGYAYNYNSDGNDADGTPFVGVDDVIINRNTNLTGELSASGALFDGKLDYIAGLYVSRTKSRQDQIFTFLDAGPVANPIFGFPLSSHVQGETVDKTQGVFAQGTYHLDDVVRGLSMTVGARYTWEQIDFVSLGGFEGFFPPGIREGRKDAEPSWQVGLEYQATEDLLLYAVHRGSWRSGGFNQSAPPVRALASDGGNMFEPEKTRDVELGLKYRGDIGGAAVRLNIAAYKQWVDDIQRVLYITLPSGLTALTTGVPGGATVKGFETDVSIRFSEWIEVGGSYAHTDGKYGDPNTVTVFGNLFTFDTFADVAKNAGSVYAKLKIPAPENYGTASLRADLYAQDGQWISNTGKSSSPDTKLPGYSLLNLQASLDDVGGTPLSIRAFVRNATKEKYYVGGISNSALLGFNLVVPGEPRFYGVELNYRF